jgi:N utilization substance protein A
MLTTATINVHELLQVADAVAREKSVDKNIVIAAMEDAISKSAKARYGTEYDIRVFINRNNGDIQIFRYTEVVDEVEFEGLQITLEQAKEYDSNVQIGEFLKEPLPPVEIGRISAQSARQVIIQRIREAEREGQYDEFVGRVGEIIHAVIKRIEFGNVFVDLGGKGEGILRRNDVIPRENLKVGDRIKAYLSDVKREITGPQIFLSRTHPQFMARLFAIEVPEIYDGIIEVKAIARDAGSRAKIAVYTQDPTLDVVGACVGLRGSRVQAVIAELQGEKIDIIEWSSDIATFVMKAVAPTQVLRVVMDDDVKKIDIVVPDGTLPQVIGKRGQNIKLLSQLVGWDVSVSTETADSERRQQEFADRTDLFIKALDVDQLLAQLLASEGFTKVEEIAYTSIEDFTSIEGFEEEIATELKNRATNYLENEKLKKIASYELDERLKAIDGMTSDMLLMLGRAKIKTIEDFAGLVPEDLVQSQQDTKTKNTAIFRKFDISEDAVEKMIMQAREIAGWLKG